MICSLCGKNKSFIWHTWDTLADAKKLKKIIGDGSFCPDCMDYYDKLKSGKLPEAETAYKYMKKIVSANQADKNIDLKKLDLHIEDLYKENAIIITERKQSFDLIVQTRILVDKKQRTITNKYGADFVFPKSSENHHFCATKHNGNLVMVENFKPQLNFPDPDNITSVKNVQNKIQKTDDNDLFMISVIPLENILSYQVIGNVEHTAVTSGGGGDSKQPNMRGAIVGGLLFGGAGAIIGSQMGAGITINPVQSSVVEYDSRVTMLNLKNAQGQAEIRELPYYYSEVFLKVIPEKEFNFIQSQKNTESTDQTKRIPEQTQNAPVNMVEEMKQLKELLDLGLITEDEFNLKRKQILKL